MEAKLGFRFHKPRPDLAVRRRTARDPMAQDVFDVEADFTWANDSAFDALQIRFPASDGITGTSRSRASRQSRPNADVPHNYNDVVGVRLGGDYNVLPDQLALRAGAFFETAARPNSGLPEHRLRRGATRFGVALGATYRIR